MQVRESVLAYEKTRDDTFFYYREQGMTLLRSNINLHFIEHSTR